MRWLLPLLLSPHPGSSNEPLVLDPWSSGPWTQEKEQAERHAGRQQSSSTSFLQFSPSINCFCSVYLLCPHQVCPFSLPGVQIHDKGTKRSQSWGLATWGGGNLPSIPTTATQRGRSSKNSVEDSFPEEGIPQQGWQELYYEAGRKGILGRGQRPGGESALWIVSGAEM